MASRSASKQNKGAGDIEDENDSRSRSNSKSGSQSPFQNLELKAAYVSAVSDGQVDSMLRNKDELLLGINYNQDRD